MATKTTKSFNYKALLRSAARRIWMWSPMRKEAIRTARVAPGTVACALCRVRMKENVKNKSYQVDHVVPASEPSSKIHSWDDFFTRLFCPASELRVLCKPCHEKKTQTENTARRRRKVRKKKPRNNRRGK